MPAKIFGALLWNKKACFEADEIPGCMTCLCKMAYYYNPTVAEHYLSRTKPEFESHIGYHLCGKGTPLEA